jgi:serine/threonine protein kinase
LPLANELGLPRVFPKIRNIETGQNERLEFKKLRKDLWNTGEGIIDYMNLIFEANLGGINVIAKVVLRPYGKDVHARLAAQDMAPRLYGTSDLHGIASVIIMEFMKDGWITLFDYRNNHFPNGIQGDHKARLLKRLDEILEFLHAGGMVHGDFRMANIMLKKGEEEKAMLIDFDWAGEAEKVKYPVTRSDGFGYPGESGGFIGASDDRRFYETWMNKI